MIWIRSQKKTSLVEVSHVTIHEYKSPSTGRVICCSIVYDTPNATFELGNYSTKEKALKVLDMIQERICAIEAARNVVCVAQRTTNYTIDCTGTVFQMPHSDEVVA